MATFQEVVERINARRSWVTSAFWPKFQGKSSARRKHVAVAEVMVSRIGQVVWWVIAVAATVGAAPAVAQSNLDAGKSPAQVFSDTCNACHRSPREIRPAGPGFLRQHYTTGGREAAAMAAYLAAIGSDPRAVQQRRPPVLGAGQAPATDATKPSPAAAAVKPRRPSESMEADRFSGAAAPADAVPAAAAAAAGHHAGEEFEE